MLYVFFASTHLCTRKEPQLVHACLHKMYLRVFSKQVVLHVLAKLITREIMGIVCECITSHDSPSSLNQVVPYMFNLGSTQIWLNSNICLNDRTFECSLSNSNFAINSIRKCALISKVEKWHPHLEALCMCLQCKYYKLICVCH